MSAARAEIEIEGYRIQELIAEGDTWLYFRALQETLQREVALKVLQPAVASDEELCQRFRREARAGARLSHPNIVRMLNQGTDERSGLPFIAFELVAGPSLEQLLADGAALLEVEALEAGLGVLVALCVAEEKGIVHRDIRPENIVVTPSGVPKLVDLGLAKGSGEEGLTRPGTIMGSPHYVAPEQVVGLENLDTRADLYALGLVLWRSVTGQLPFEGKEFFAVASRHVNEDVPDPRSVSSQVSAGMAALIAGMSAREPDERYRSAAAALIDAQRLQEGQPVLGPQAAGQESIARGAGLPRRLVGQALKSLVERTGYGAGDKGPGALLETEQQPRPQLKPEARGNGFTVTVTREGDPVVSGHFDQEVVVMGRSAEADLRIDLPIVSRRHAGLSRNPRGGFVLTAYSTTNATTVNGKRVELPVPVGLHDAVVLADELLVVVTADDPARGGTAKFVPVVDNDDTPLTGAAQQPPPSSAPGKPKRGGTSVMGFSAGAALPSPAPAEIQRATPVPEAVSRDTPPPATEPAPAPAPEREDPDVRSPATGRWARALAKPVSEDELGRSSVFVPDKRAPAGSLEQPPAADIPQGQADRLLHAARAAGASDLHLIPGLPALHRVDGELVSAGGEPLSPEEVEALVLQLTTPDQQASFYASGDLDMCYAAQHGRYRTNACRHRTGPCLTCRVVPTEVTSLEALGVPAGARRLTEYAQGLVLITGPLGAGKTTTMMALVELVNRGRHDHIITVEDPIEQLLAPAQCQVSQRQLGEHTASFEAALRGALREDPDIIVIGDLRDHATAALAISAAETGHLVFASMPAMSAAKSLDKLVDMFPAGEQLTIRTSVSESLRGVLCQRLVPAKAGGRVLAVELLFNTIGVANIIRDGKTGGLTNAMQLGKSQGMQTLKVAIDGLLAAGSITPDVAEAALKA